MWTARCIAYGTNGRVCLQPAEFLDPQRRGMVCETHRPVSLPCSVRAAELAVLRDAASAALIECLVEFEFESMDYRRSPE